MNYEDMIERIFEDYFNMYQEMMDELIMDSVLEHSMNDEDLKRKDKVKVHLEKVQYQDEECECEICFDKVKKGDKVYNLDCFHKFHADCLMEWIHYKSNCPVCRYDIQ